MYIYKVLSLKTKIYILSICYFYTYAFKLNIKTINSYKVFFLNIN